jgi:hypothetical protein
MKRRSLVLASIVTLASPEAYAAANEIQLVYVGGRDCPACAEWVRDSRPRFLASSLYKKVRYVEVETARMRAAYDVSNWPDHLVTILQNLPLKSGTPRFLIVMNGQLYANELGRWNRTVSYLRELIAIA